jgi:L-aspartate semialdehyde sulfurtransferase ferredoxin
MKKRYILTFPATRVEEAIAYHLVKEYDIVINILKADISPGYEGHLLVEMKANAQALEKGIEYLNEHHITCASLDKRLTLKKEQCIHCGACTAVCSAGALTMNKETWKLKFTPESCIACELCLKACPLQLFSIEFSE